MKSRKDWKKKELIKKEIHVIKNEFYTIIGIVDNPMNRCVDLVIFKYSKLLSRLNNLVAGITDSRSVKKIDKKMTDWVVDGILKQYEDLCNQHDANYKTRLESLTRVVNMYYGSLWYDDTNETNKKIALVNKLLFPER